MGDSSLFERAFVENTLIWTKEQLPQRLNLAHRPTQKFVPVL
jgi:hypothetical protein